MKKIIVTAAVVLIAIVACAKNTSNVRIYTEMRPEVNYVTHLYTLAGLGFSDEEYVAKYGNTVSDADLNVLRKNASLLTFGKGEGGMLAGAFFFGVSGNDISSATDMKVFMDSLASQAQAAGSPKDILDAANAIAKVYKDNYGRYLTEVYPKAKADMEARASQLNGMLEKNEFVTNWEHVTGYTWTHGDYHWLLYRAGINGPSYNNLNENTNTVYYNQPVAYQYDMFSHEFGIFLMMEKIDPVFNELKDYCSKMQGKNDFTYVPWSAFESLACWYNCMIAGHKTEDFKNFGEADVKEFCRIYDKLANCGISDPVTLYRTAVVHYLRDHKS